jgi:hypothetical protein
MDTAVIKNVPAFVKRHEAAFDSLNKFFDSTLPKKIDFFVWSDSVLADSMLRKKLAFTEGALCLTHTMPGHTVGHEITHSLIAHALPITATTKLISEGTCVYFDLSMKDNLKMLRAKRPEYSVEDIWKGSYKVGDDILYPMGGELVKRLMALGGKEKFMKLLSNQTYENAVLIYGDEFKPMMKALQADIVKQEIKK